MTLGSSMHSFTDSAGRAWNIEINVAAVKRVRAMLEVDLYRLLEDGVQGLEKLLGNVVLLVDVIYVLCRDQAIAVGVSDEQFGAAFSGDSLDAAATAFVEELIDFFPNRQAKSSLRKLIGKGRQMGVILVEKMDQQMDALDLESEAEKLIGSFGGLPAKSAATQDSLHSVS